MKRQNSLNCHLLSNRPRPSCTPCCDKTRPSGESRAETIGLLNMPRPSCTPRNDRPRPVRTVLGSSRIVERMFDHVQSPCGVWTLYPVDHVLEEITGWLFSLIEVEGLLSLWFNHKGAIGGSKTWSRHTNPLECWSPGVSPSSKSAAWSAGYSWHTSVCRLTASVCAEHSDLLIQAGKTRMSCLGPVLWSLSVSTLCASGDVDIRSDLDIRSEVGSWTSGDVDIICWPLYGIPYLYKWQGGRPVDPCTIGDVDILSNL